MIDIALTFLQNELQTFLFNRTRSGAIQVKLSKISTETGSYAFPTDTIALSVINIEEERTFKSQLPEYTYKNGQHIQLEPELKLCIHLIVAANFTSYGESLKMISHVLTFFQSHQRFTSIEFPALDREVGKITAELLSPSYEQLNQIWSYIGSKQLPSVFYKLRLVVIQNDAVSTVQPPLTTIITNLSGK